MFIRFRFFFSIRDPDLQQEVDLEDRGHPVVEIHDRDPQAGSPYFSISLNNSSVIISSKGFRQYSM